LKKIAAICNSINEKLSYNFHFDVRAFALFRIFFGFVMLLDLCIRLSDFEVFYTESGVLPLSFLKQQISFEWHIPFYTYMDKAWFIATCFGIHLISVFLFLIGYRTKIAQLVCLAFYIGLHTRNTYLLQGGDDLIRGLLFFSLFLPLNAIWAIKRSEVKTNYTLPALLLSLQVMLVYFVSATMKGEREWFYEGSALYYAFNLDFMQWPLAKYLANYPAMLVWLTRAVSVMEFGIPIVFFVALRSQKMRLVCIGILVVFQLGIASTLFVGLFYLINLAALIPLLPSRFFDYWGIKYQAINMPLRSSLLKNTVVIGLTVYLLLWHMNYMPFAKFGLSSKLTSLAYPIGINQSWGMFSPCVFKEDGWLIYEAVTTENDTIDLKNNSLPVNYNKPANILATFKNDRWRKYSEYMVISGSDWIRPPFVEYVKRKSEKEVKSIRLLYMLELTMKPDEQFKIQKRYLN
jgi:hypothetical protein